MFFKSVSEFIFLRIFENGLRQTGTWVDAAAELLKLDALLTQFDAISSRKNWGRFDVKKNIR
jgi:hypothetical protein